MKKLKIILTLIMALILLCSCGQGAKTTEDATDASKSDAFDKPSMSFDVSPSDVGDGDEAEYGKADDGAPATGAAEAADGAPSVNGAVEEKDIAAGTLTAGEWKDNDNYDFWLNVLARDGWKEFSELWKVQLTKRLVFTVTNGQNPIKNAKVIVMDSENAPISEAYTDSYGKAYVYYDVANEGKNPAKYHITSDYIADDVAEFTPITDAQMSAGGIDVDVSGWGYFNDLPQYRNLDIMFTTDTTGSMSDELEYLKKELTNVITRAADENESYDIRVSVNFYRDEGDEYVVRDFAFSGDIDEVQRQIDVQFSDGGGDYPEAVHTALRNSIHDHEWRADAIKILFLTLDARGHSEVDGVVEDIRASVVEAASRGIRIVPIASSGVDTETEFMLRMMACVSGGTYTFLTDHSGVGDAHLEPTIGDYNVKMLNDLLVKIISEYCK